VSVVSLPVTVLLDNVRSVYNVGAFFRTADAASVERLLLSGFTAAPPHKGIGKTALGADAVVSWERLEAPEATLDELRHRGYELVAIETSETAVDLYEWQPRFPVCVVFGHEVDGVRPALLAKCDRIVRIPMYGRKRSLNVATAGGIVIYELLRRHRAAGG
jgi:23S rRNA (guanosine2251-2'-O)-methyltransferase